MTDAEKSAYLLMAAGAIWLLVGIVELWRARRGRSRLQASKALFDLAQAEQDELDSQ